MLAVCLRSLRVAQACFGTPLTSFPEAASALKEPEAELAAREDVAGYLTGPRRLVSQVCLDLRALGWRARWRLAREHLLPAPGYVRARDSASRLTLPFLYAYRVWRGAPRWLRR